MLGTAILVNVLWGLIDGFAVVFGRYVDDVAEDESVRALRSGEGDVDDVIEGFSDSLVAVLDRADQEKTWT